MSEAKGDAYEGYAILELMGHRKLGGKVSQAEMFGAAFCRIDIEDEDGKVTATQFYGGASIYAMTPTTQEVARRMAARFKPAPVTRWELPAPKATGDASLEGVSRVSVRVGDDDLGDTDEDEDPDY